MFIFISFSLLESLDTWSSFYFSYLRHLRFLMAAGVSFGVRTAHPTLFFFIKGVPFSHMMFSSDPDLGCLSKTPLLLPQGILSGSDSSKGRSEWHDECLRQGIHLEHSPLLSLSVVKGEMFLLCFGDVRSI